MPSFLSLIPSWAWRWIAIGGVAVAFGVVCYFKGMAHVQSEFDDYKAEVKAAGDRQNLITQQTISIHKQLQETADAKAQSAAAERDLSLRRLRDIQGAIAGISLLPTPAPNTTSGNNICFAADKLDEGLRNAIAGVANRLGPIAQEGQRGIDTAVIARDWAISLKGSR